MLAEDVQVLDARAAACARGAEGAPATERIPAPADARTILDAEAQRCAEGVVFCVGSVLRGDDAAGPLLARALEERPVTGWTPVDGGQTPENDLGYVRRVAPRRLVLVDAAAMGLEPGSVRRLLPEHVAVQSLITTHTLPITYLLGELEKACDDVVFLGIQPASTEFFDPVDGRVLTAVESIYDTLVTGGDVSRYPLMGA